ncbi:dynactin subunit 2 [Microplitis mediator]|uniref:dynactin subunit 2 n=1 Tax=Microplitis mediator TaxID=375433 RepID=UPI0025525ED1|nr:dynactin subunit 2 [Microplitis mediator]
MADSKYADLPGIAYNQVDVYETTDLPESEQYPNENEDETESIEKLHISASEAFNKFKGKQVVTKGVDFSDRISRKPRTGYNAVFGVWELPGEGEQETPIQKYQRLQCEIKDLYDEVNQLKENAKEEEEIKNAADILVQVEDIGKQLSILRVDECLGTDLVSTLTDPQGTRLKQLELQIEQFKNVGTVDKPGVKGLGQGDSVPPTGTLKYEMVYLPERSRMQETARVAQLEHRLARLEGVVGTSDDKLAKFTQNLKSQGVIEAVQQLAAKSALLDSTQVEAMEGRIATLSHRLDTVAQKKSALSADSERDQKIAEMYDIMQKTEPIAQVLPETIERMIALNAIHRRAAEFSKSLAQLEELQSQITGTLESNKSVLKGIQESFATNMEVIGKNIAHLEERLSKLKK